MNRPAISVIVTVRNEADNIRRLLESIAAQSVRADEVVVVDGGSTDGTWEILQSMAGADMPTLEPLSLPGSNISAGRNAAIRHARGPVIVSTDAGVSLAPDWLDAITAPVASGHRFVAGFFVADPTNAFETALGATTLPMVDEIDPARFLPSSRSVAFYKDDWAQSGGYPEWLDFGEDLVFDMRLEHVAGRPAFAPGAIAMFRPRDTLRAFARQYYLYARGDGKADLWAWRHAIRYGVYLVAAPTLVAMALLVHPVLWLATSAGLASMVFRPYRRLVRQWSHLSGAERGVAALWVPVARVTGDLAKMVGYPVGRWWRRSHRPPDWRPAPDVGRR